MNLSQRITQLTGLAAMPLLLISCSPQTQEAELILTNAYIWTGNPEQPQAQGLAISGDTLLAVGSNEEILRLKGADTKLIDVDGQFIALLRNLLNESRNTLRQSLPAPGLLGANGMAVIGRKSLQKNGLTCRHRIIRYF